jgi:hypothetical protein
MENTDTQALFVIEPLQQSTGAEIPAGGGCSNCNCNSNSNGSSEELLA